LLLHIGIDDTDSPKAGCTTYIAARLVERFLGMGARFVDYPNLLRLNPNVPWKTRGNGAICLRIEIESELEGPIMEEVIKEVEGHSEFECENTNPGTVFHTGEIPMALKRFSERVVQGLANLEEASSLVEEHGASAVGYKNMRGIIGALAAIGGLQGGDHTFEFLSYREPGNCGKPRLVDAPSVRAMDDEAEGSTFNNIDPETGRVLIAPHGSDPVLFGVRGETAESVYRAAKMVEPGEAVERWVIFRSNQGTDAHLRCRSKLSELEPYGPAIVVGEVADRPRTIQGGHVIFGLGDDTAQIDCAAYEPTGGFREIVRQLVPGDGVRAHGGVKEAPVGGRMTLNLEKLEVLRLAPDVRFVNPTCPACGGGTESMGRGKGFRCRKCGFKDGRLRKRAIETERRLETGLHVPPPRAQRHLTKPLVRYGREKREYALEDLFEPWHWP
jgi:tRNA(Ile2)-agmatinylcytidine synthase